MDDLASNIIDVIKEEQIKLGYRKEKIRLYYPLSSLNTLMGRNSSSEQMQKQLQEYFAAKNEVFGEVKVSHKNERFCIYLPEEATEYVHNNTEDSGFLYDFISTIGGHHVSIETVLELFRRYSDDVHFEKMKDEDFDYLLYFVNEEPDSYRYCLTEEGHHMIYHRYTKKDFEELF